MLGVALIAFAASSLAAEPDIWQQLADPEFAVREAASARLLAMGPSIRAQVAAHTVSGPLEQRERCIRVLRMIDRGLDASLPADALDALADYDYDAPTEEKMHRIGVFRPAALRVGLNEPDPDVRVQIYNRSNPRAVTAYVSSLADAPQPDLGAIEAYGRAYERCGDSHNALTLEMTALRLTGRLEAEIQTLLTVPMRTPIERYKLASLLFFVGRDAEAIAEASVDGGPLRAAIAIRQGDWPTLLRLQIAKSRPVVAGRVTAERLAGNAEAAEQQLNDWIANPPGNSASTLDLAIACLLNGRLAEGVDRFPTGTQRLPRAALLRVQGRWGEAFTAASEAKDFAEWARMKREAGQAPPVAIPPPEVQMVETPPSALGPAADAWHRGDAAATLEALQHVGAPSPDVDAARLLLPLCQEKLGQMYAARMSRKAIDVHLAARSQGWIAALTRLDAAGLGDVADAEANRLSRLWPDNLRVIGEVARRDARRAVARKDWPAAVAAYDRLMAVHSSGSVMFSDPTGY
ncbi:MAG: hypothetical protein JWM57_270, partial [Phycisphaerales bacterium]|nr:hypothetical protein [Phycisphaerales bacterium]